MHKKGRVLVVDDEVGILKVIEEVLIDEYYVKTCDNATLARDLIHDESFDAVVSDINMPGMTGLELLKVIKSNDEQVPVILITGKSDKSNLKSAISFGAYDFIEKPFSLMVLKKVVQKAVHKHQIQVQDDNYRDSLEKMVQLRTKALTKLNRKLEENLVKTMMAMVNALEASDAYTHGHSQRVTSISLLIAQAMGFTYDQRKILRLGAVMHDIGKIGVDPSILNKPGKLSDIEYKQIQKHPVVGHKIMSPIELEPEILNIIIQHHEKYDGTGYPNKLRKDEISIYARIVQVADSYDAMTSNRPYRKAQSNDYGYSEIVKNSGSQFDPQVVEAFKKIYHDITAEALSKIFF